MRSDSGSSSSRSIEDRLRQTILGPLQASGDRLVNWGCGVSLLSVPVTFFLVFYLFRFEFWAAFKTAALSAVGLGVVAIGVVARVDSRGVEWARSEFDRMFPAGSEQRVVALRCLASHPSDQDGIRRFKEAMGVAGETIGPASGPEEMISDFLEGLEAPPPTPVSQALETQWPGGADQGRAETGPAERRVHLDFDEVDWDASFKKRGATKDRVPPAAAAAPRAPAGPGKKKDMKES